MPLGFKSTKLTEHSVEDATNYKRNRQHRLALFWRVFLPSAAILAVVAGGLALSPARVPAPESPEKVAIFLAGLGTMLLINLALMRRAFSPLERLTAAVSEIDPLKPGHRVPLYGPSAEATELAESINQMLDRLETERRDFARRSMAAEEDERRRIARELHDEVGQDLTAVMLQLSSASRSDDGSREALAEATEAMRGLVDDLNRVVRQLRPEALDDLGLESALKILVDQLMERADIQVLLAIDTQLPLLTPEEELVLYRIAQESLTNVARHAEATRAELRLRASDAGMTLSVRDNGRGLNGAPAGNGVRGMRERALLVGADLAMDSSPGKGVEVRVTIPASSGSE